MLPNASLDCIVNVAACPAVPTLKLSPDNIRDLYLELHTEKHEVSAEEYGRLVQRLDPSHLNKQRVVGIARRAQEEHAQNAQEQLRADERGTLEDNAEVGISRRDGGGKEWEQA